MSGHPQFEEDFELYALGVLDGDEKASLEGHLPGCAECQSRLDGARGRMALLALSAPQTDPPAGVRHRLLDQFKAERAGKPAAQPPLRNNVVPMRRSAWAPLWAAAAVVLLAAAAWFAVENRRLGDQLAQ